MKGYCIRLTPTNLLWLLRKVTKDAFFTVQLIAAEELSYCSVKVISFVLIKSIFTGYLPGAAAPGIDVFNGI